jgi:hypothetical protein
MSLLKSRKSYSKALKVDKTDVEHVVDFLFGRYANATSMRMIDERFVKSLAEELKPHAHEKEFELNEVDKKRLEGKLPRTGQLFNELNEFYQLVMASAGIETSGLNSVVGYNHGGDMNPLRSGRGYRNMAVIVAVQGKANVHASSGRVEEARLCSDPGDVHFLRAQKIGERTRIKQPYDVRNASPDRLVLALGEVRSYRK